MQTVTVRDGYVEVLFSGVVDPVSARGAVTADGEVVAAIRASARILFDASMVQSFGYDARTLGEAMKRLAGDGLRLAVVSSNAEMFGVGRQVAQYSGVEGASIAVFRDQASALEWLLKEGEGGQEVPE